MSDAPEKQILATPDIGWVVHYYRDDQNLDDPIAAMVVAQEGPGRVSICLFENRRMPTFKSGVNWSGDNRRILPNRPFRVNGCWDFPPHSKQRDAMKFHKEILDKHQAKQKAVEDQAEQDRIRLLKQHAERKKALEPTSNRT